MIYITLHNSIYSEDLTVVDDMANPLKVHYLDKVKNSKKVKRGLAIESEVLIDEVLKEHKSKLETTFKSGRNGFILSAGNTVWSGAGIKIIKRPTDYPEMRVIPMGVCNIVAGKKANALGSFEHISTDSTSCISGSMALKMAKLLIDAGELDRVIIVSADNGTSYALQEFFTTSKACTTIATEGTKDATFHLAQSANYIVIENAYSLKETGNKPCGELLDVFTCAEYYQNPLGITEDGDGYKKILEKTISKNKDINTVKFHGTGTPDNAIEDVVVNKYLDNYNSLKYKNKIGHSLGSNCNVELSLALRDAKKGKLLSLSAGMGNVFSGVLVDVW